MEELTLNQFLECLAERIAESTANKVVELLKATESQKPDRLLSPKEAAAHLGVTTQTIWRWKKGGLLTAHRFGGLVRYLESDLLRVGVHKGLQSSQLKKGGGQ